MSPMLLFETVYSYRKIVDLYAHLSGFNRTSSSWDWNVKQLSPFSTTLSPTIYIWNGFLCCCCCFFLVLTRYLSIWLRNFSVAHTQWVSVCVFSRLQTSDFSAYEKNSKMVRVYSTCFPTEMIWNAYVRFMHDIRFIRFSLGRSCRCFPSFSVAPLALA